VKSNGYPDRRNHRPPTTTHLPSGKYSLCGAYYSDNVTNVTCKRCMRSVERLIRECSSRMSPLQKLLPGELSAH